MTSRHVSNGTNQKKLSRYGIPSSKRQNGSSTSVTGISGSSKETLSSFANTDILYGYNSSVKDHHNPQKYYVTDAETAAEKMEFQKQENTYRKRKHAKAFDSDAASNIKSTKPNSQTRKLNSSRSSLSKLRDRDMNDFGHAAKDNTEVLITKIDDLECVEYQTDGSRLSKTGIAPRAIGTPENWQETSTSSTLRKPRLIDALTAQRLDNPSVEGPHKIGNFTAKMKFSQNSIAQHEFITPPDETRPRGIGHRGTNTIGRKIKLTYSPSRTISSNTTKTDRLEPGGYELEEDVPANEIIAQLSPESLAANACDDADDANSKPAIQSVHELRRAGVNNRFSDEMDDLLSRIGNPRPSPSTMRRNALCELAIRIQNEEFATQFRDHASRDSIAKDVCSEKDIISAFALVAVLVVFISSGPAPHLLRQLSDERIGLWLGGLLELDDDINTLAAQRTLNVPGATRKSLGEVKKIAVQGKVWHGCKIKTVSPRTVALQLLNILIHCADTQQVQSLLDDSAKDLSQLSNDHATRASLGDADFGLLVSILEAQSNLADVLERPATRMQQEASNVAGFIQTTLQDWPQNHNNTDAILLKLAINITNNKVGAGAFDDIYILSFLIERICAGFAYIQGITDNLNCTFYDELILILGIMINVLEQCPSARASTDKTAVEDLAKLWQKNQVLISEADSIEKSKLSVAFGYLAVLLGYLALVQPAVIRLQNNTNWPTIQSLIQTIQEFITMSKTVDNKVYELECLVHQLKLYNKY